MRIGFATCTLYADLTADDRLAMPLLARQGIDVVPYVWDEASPAPVDALVLRSCWDYHLKTPAFARWLEQPPAPLFNPPSILRWNLHKTYLEDLRKWGFHVPQTVWLEAGTRVDLPALLAEHGLNEVVVKPAVGMNGFDTFRTSRPDAARRQLELDALTTSRAVMIQEFIPEVLTAGETSLLFFDGEFSHAVSKVARPGEFRIHEEYGGTRRGVTPDGALIDEARQILGRLPGPLLYARVDGIVTAGRLAIMEIELIDPALYLACDPEAPSRFAAAVTRQVSQGRQAPG